MKKKICYIFILIFAYIFFANDTTVLAVEMSGGSFTGEIILTSDTTYTSTIAVPGNETLILDLNGYVLDNYNDERPIFVSVGGTLIIRDSNPTSIHYGTLTDDLWVYDSTATSGIEIQGGIITGGIRSDRGGAIFNSGTVIMEGGTIAGCKAIANSSSTENSMTDYPVNTFTNGVGGAVFINDGGSFELNGGAIKYCKAEPSSEATLSGGGAVFVDANENKVGTFTMKSGTISNCFSLNGGAVFVHSNLTTGNTLETASSFNMSGGEILNCYSTGTGDNCGGGAVFVNATLESESAVASVASFNMSGGVLKENISNGMGGGAVYILGNFTMSNNATLTGNLTKKMGEVVDDKEVYDGLGGAVFAVNETANFTMNGGTISDCIASSGGGVMVFTSALFTMNGGKILNCSAQGSGGTGNGGAVYVMASTFYFNEGTLDGNWARRYGGAININKTANLYLNGACNIINNIANHGGGISQEDGDCQIKLNNQDILIKGNSAINGNGGGLFIEKGILDISACTIIGNSASNNGGGISLRVERIGGDITVNMTGGTITENTAKVNGGGIDIFADYTFTENDQSNDANHKNDVVVNIKSGILSNNNADRNGGGINVYINEENGTAVMNIQTVESLSAPEIEGNTSLSNGGGICINGGSVNMTNGTINNCTAIAGGGVYISAGDMEITGGQVNNCEATVGGGICLYNGNINMSAGTMNGNTADEGGAIYLSEGSVNMSGGTILNSSAVSGGAVYINSGNFQMPSGTIIDNTATNEGGAVCVKDGDIVIGLETCKGIDTSHIHPNIANNTALDYGGGISISGGQLDMYCGTIQGNLLMGGKAINNIDQSAGVVNVYGGSINGGIAISSGTFTDYTKGSESTLNTITYYSEDENGTTTVAKVTSGTEVSLLGNVFEREGYHLIGWKTDKNSEEILYVGSIYTVESDTNLYAVWGEEEPNTSYIVYIPDTIEIDEKQKIGTINIGATLKYFINIASLTVNIENKDELVLGDNSISYTLKDSNEGVVENGDTVATFSNKDQNEKILNLEIISIPQYAGVYTDILTFNVTYDNGSQ